MNSSIFKLRVNASDGSLYWDFWLNHDYGREADKCRHVKPKPLETIEGVRDCAKLDILDDLDYMPALDLIDRAFECGKRDGAGEES